MKVVCIGGGAASFFFAANLAQLHPEWEIIILEQGKKVLNKVLISGGGRCNVTHHCFDPKELVHSYPRGHKELLGPFFKFGPSQLIDWFESKGVSLKVEEDGRMFPTTDDSSTIANCLIHTCQSNGVKIWTQQKVTNIIPHQGGQKGFTLHLLHQQKLDADKLFVAPGSSKQMWQVLQHLGHRIIPPVPSLFTFRLKETHFQELAGISLEAVQLIVPELKLQSQGPLLFTHKGLSGPAVLKLSSWGARSLHEIDYQFDLKIDFLPHQSAEQLLQHIRSNGKLSLGNRHVLGVPKRLGATLLATAGLRSDQRIDQMSNKGIQSAIVALKETTVKVVGQNRFKEEFVTAGGVALKEINFRNFSSKVIQNMYLAGEILNIDAVTGGYNFQAAWTGAYLAATECD